MKCFNHPQFLTVKQECQSLWQESYYSPHAIWYMLVGFLLLSWIMFQWILGQYHISTDFSQSLSLLTQQSLNKPISQNTQLGGERLFGQPMSFSAQQALRHAFKLEGILYDDNPKKRAAVLKDNSGEVKFYYQGDALPGGAKLINVGPDYIEIESQGFQQRLKLEHYPASFLSDQPLNSGSHLFSQ